MSFEIPIFHYSDKLLKVLNNHQLMTIACLAYISRVIWYTSFQNPWLVLVVEPLHGVTFACKALGMLYISWSSFVRSPPVSVSRLPWHHDDGCTRIQQLRRGLRGSGLSARCQSGQTPDAPASSHPRPAQGWSCSV